MYTGSEPRPRIEIKREGMDFLLDGLALLACLVSIAGLIYYYPDLPDRVATHYNFAGEPDGYGEKSTMIILVVVQLVMFLGLLMITRIPHQFNYLVKITEENAERQYSIAIKMIRSLNAIICFTFGFIIWKSIANGLGMTVGIGTYTVTGMLVVMFGSIFFFLYRSLSNK